MYNVNLVKDEHLLEDHFKSLLLKDLRNLSPSRVLTLEHKKYIVIILQIFV